MANGLIDNIMLTGMKTDDIEVGGNINNQHNDYIHKWAGSLERMLQEVPQYMFRPGCTGRISKIPNNLREVDVKAYEPYFLSLGPYHHGKPMVQSMEKKKLSVLKWVLKFKPEVTLKDYLMEMKSMEQITRSFYTDIEMESEKFLWMLLVDSMYIVTSFCGQERLKQINKGTSGEFGGNENKHIMAETGDSDGDMSSGEENMMLLYSTTFQHDLFLWENQLPFFVLERIYALAYGNSETQFISTVEDRVADLLLGYIKLNSHIKISLTTEIHHLLHLCHLFFRPTIQHESTTSQLLESRQLFRLGSAMQLYETGVNFMVRPDSTQQSLLDVTFSSSGMMVLPRLCVDDNTNSLLRNLIAFVQMKYPSMGLDVSAYAVLLLHLVTTPEDAQLLRRKEIIQHHLANDKEMMYLVNKLSVGLSFDYAEDSYSLKSVFRELNRYSEHRVPRWRAWFKHKYFNNPWTVISLFATSSFLILCLVQTYYTVYSYYHPYSGGHL